MQPSLARPFRSSDQSAGDDMAASRRKNFGSSRTTSNLDAILGDENQTWTIGRLNPVAHCGESTLKELRIATEPLEPCHPFGGGAGSPCCRAILLAYTSVGQLSHTSRLAADHFLRIWPAEYPRSAISRPCRSLREARPFRAWVWCPAREQRGPSDKENDNGKMESSRSSSRGTRHGGS